MPHITINGIQLYYEAHGEGAPVLLIHGLGSSSRDWEWQIPEFSKKYQVIAFDVRGHGRSGKPAGPYHMRQFADDAAYLLRVLGAVPAHIVGISMGGMIAYQLAVSHPEVVCSLVPVNCAPELPIRTLKDRFTMWQRMMIVRLLGMRKMGEVLSKRLFIKPEQEELRRIFVERWAENDPRAYLAALRALIGWSVVEQLGAIRAPTLVLSSDEDYTFIGDKERYAAQMPQAEMVVIADARHALPVEKPEEFNRAVLAFLERVET